MSTLIGIGVLLGIAAAVATTKRSPYCPRCKATVWGKNHCMRHLLEGADGQ